MDDAAAEEFLARHRKAVLITIRADGRPQSSNVLYTFADGVARVSVTAPRAKTRNVARDPRAVLHVSASSFWQYVSASCTVELSAVSVEKGDAAGRELLDVYNAIADEPHPDPDEFFGVQVAEQRRVMRLRPDGYAGMV